MGMIGMSVLRGITVECLLNEGDVPSVKATDLMEYHRRRPRTGSDDWRESGEVKHPPFWSFRNDGHLPRKIFESLLAFDQSCRDLLLLAEAATSKSDVPGKPEPLSVVSGEFTIKHAMRVVVSPWGIAWWDDKRTTTSYVAPFEMISTVRVR